MTLIRVTDSDSSAQHFSLQREIKKHKTRRKAMPPMIPPMTIPAISPSDRSLLLKRQSLRFKLRVKKILRSNV